MRRPLAVIPAAALLLVIAAVASAGPRDAELGRLAADGPVTLASNLPGTALLHAENVKPGDHVSGMISLTNKGDRPVRSSSASRAGAICPGPAAAASPASCACGSRTSAARCRRASRRSTAP